MFQYSRLRFLPPPGHADREMCANFGKKHQSIRGIQGDIPGPETETGSNSTTIAVILTIVGL